MKIRQLDGRWQQTEKAGRAGQSVGRQKVVKRVAKRVVIEISKPNLAQHWCIFTTCIAATTGVVYVLEVTDKLTDWQYGQNKTDLWSRKYDGNIYESTRRATRSGKARCEISRVKIGQQKFGQQRKILSHGGEIWCVSDGMWRAFCAAMPLI